MNHNSYKQDIYKQRNRHKFEEDQMDELINLANQFILEKFDEQKHHVCCVIKLTNGQIIKGLHLGTYASRASICAEAVAVGNLITSLNIKEYNIEMIVTVNKLGIVVNPCGICRELIYDYFPNAKIIINNNGNYEQKSIEELLPNKYIRNL
jgi:cytidine deaminase